MAAMMSAAVVVLLIIVLLLGPALEAFQYTIALAVRTLGCWVVALLAVCPVFVWLIAAYPHRRQWVR